jgi:hypothetical protein
MADVALVALPGLADALVVEAMQEEEPLMAGAQFAAPPDPVTSIWTPLCD